MRADNTHHLREAVQQRQQRTRQRAEDALAELLSAEEPVTISLLARRAGVARSWIYSQPDLLARIEQSHTTAPAAPTASRITASEASWKQRLDLAHERIRELTAENKQLREQLARAHGHLRAQRGSTPHERN